MKNVALLVALLLATNCCFCQVTDAKLQVDTITKPALYMETTLSESDVNDALENYFGEVHVQKEKGSGFIFKKKLPLLTFRNAVAQGMNGKTLDYFFKVDSRRQKGPDVTTIYVAASQGYNNYLSPESELWANLKKFAAFLLNNYFQQDQLNKHIKDLSKDVDRDTNKIQGLQADLLKLQRDTASKNAQLNLFQGQLQTLKNNPGN